VFSPKAKLLPLRIWHNATVAEIAEVAQCTHADVITTARLCRFADEYATADAGNKTPARARTHVIAVVPFGDLTKLVKALGYVAVPVPNPNASPTTAAVPDGDVQRRCVLVDTHAHSCLQTTTNTGAMCAPIAGRDNHGPCRPR
jgi:hypothetical protein